MKYAIALTLIFLIGAVIIVVTPRSSSPAGPQQTGSDKSAARPEKATCTLSTGDLQDRMGVLEKLGRGVTQRRELDDGFAFGFPAEDEWLTAITEVVALERKCCTFFTFRIVVEPNGGPIWLELAGPEGTKEFLRSQLGF